MSPWPDGLFDLALCSLTAVLPACAACATILVAILAVDLLREPDPGPAIRAQQAAVPGSSP